MARRCAARAPHCTAPALACALLLACCASAAAAQGRGFSSEAPRSGVNASALGVQPARRALLGLFSGSGAAKEEPVDPERIEKIGYVKTHKTGSTTLGAALFRFGARYEKRFYCQGTGAQPCKRGHILWPGRPLPANEAFDMQINHLNGNGKLRGPFGHVVAWYRAMLGVAGGAGAPPPAWALLVPVREPVSHYLSWYYYFGEPDNRLSVEAWARTGLGTNVLASEFGVFTDDDVEGFVKYMGWGNSAGKGIMGGAQQVWLPMERFEEAMLLLRRTLHWSLLDITYAVLFDSRRTAATRWDGRRIKPTPKVSSLEPALVARIRELNYLDGRIYDTAVAVFEKALDEARGEDGSEARAAWDADAAEFTRMQAALTSSFKADPGHKACEALRAWYTMSDVEYEGHIGFDGMARAPDAAQPEAMMDAYRRSSGKLFC